MKLGAHMQPPSEIVSTFQHLQKSIGVLDPEKVDMISIPGCVTADDSAGNEIDIPNPAHPSRMLTSFQRRSSSLIPHSKPTSLNLAPGTVPGLQAAGSRSLTRRFQKLRLVGWLELRVRWRTRRRLERHGLRVSRSWKRQEVR